MCHWIMSQCSSDSYDGTWRRLFSALMLQCSSHSDNVAWRRLFSAIMLQCSSDSYNGAWRRSVAPTETETLLQCQSSAGRRMRGLWICNNLLEPQTLQFSWALRHLFRASRSACVCECENASHVCVFVAWQSLLVTGTFPAGLFAASLYPFYFSLLSLFPVHIFPTKSFLRCFFFTLGLSSTVLS